MTRAADRRLDIYAVVSDDVLLDRVGGGGVDLDLFDGSTIESLLQQWRADCLLDLPPAPTGRRVRRASHWGRRAPRRESAGLERRRSPWQAATGIAASIILLLGGTTVAGSRTARPGDALWPVTQLLWSDRADSVLASQAVHQLLGEAHQALQAGDLGRARIALAAAAGNFPRIQAQDGRESMLADLQNTQRQIDSSPASAGSQTSTSTTSDPDVPAAAVRKDGADGSPSTGSAASNGPATDPPAAGVPAAGSSPGVASGDADRGASGGPDRDASGTGAGGAASRPAVRPAQPAHPQRNAGRTSVRATPTTAGASKPAGSVLARPPQPDPETGQPAEPTMKAHRTTAAPTSGPATSAQQPTGSTGPSGSSTAPESSGPGQPSDSAAPTTETSPSSDPSAPSSESVSTPPTTSADSSADSSAGSSADSSDPESIPTPPSAAPHGAPVGPPLSSATSDHQPQPTSIEPELAGTGADTGATDPAADQNTEPADIDTAAHFPAVATSSALHPN